MKGLTYSFCIFSMIGVIHTKIIEITCKRGHIALKKSSMNTKLIFSIGIFFLVTIFWCIMHITWHRPNETKFNAVHHVQQCGTSLDMTRLKKDLLRNQHNFKFLLLNPSSFTFVRHYHKEQKRYRTHHLFVPYSSRWPVLRGHKYISPRMTSISWRSFFERKMEGRRRRD
jgi:hypothetical protein